MRSRSPSTKDRYYKKKVKSNYIKFKQPIHKSEVKLDLFKEKEKLLLVGEFPGLSEGDLLININPNSLKVLTKPEALRCYYASMELPEAFETYIKEKSLRNGIMALILEQVAYEKVPEPLQEIFNDCLSLYPELDSVELKLIKSRRSENRDSLDGAKGKNGSNNCVIIFVPDKLWGLWDALRPIIHHELSHFINLENPDNVFYERADSKSIKLWEMLKKDNLVDCHVD